MTTSFSILMACRNRREKTLSALESLQRAAEFAKIDIKVYLVDDGSSDDTSGAVAMAFPGVHVIAGTGELYWAGGMRLAECSMRSSKLRAQYVVWLNDDVSLTIDALAKAVTTLVSLNSNFDSNNSLAKVGACVGAFRSAVSGETTYGGLRAPDERRPLSFKKVEVSGVPVDVDTMNGNFVLFIAEAYDRMGGIPVHFVHGMADIWAGLRLRALGYRVVQIPGAIGYCENNPVQESKQLPRFFAGVRAALQAKRFPVRAWYTLVSVLPPMQRLLYLPYPYLKAFLGLR